jgi:hypothetical protein
VAIGNFAGDAAQNIERSRSALSITAFRIARYNSTLAAPSSLFFSAQNSFRSARGARTIKECSEAFVGFDTAENKHAVAIVNIGGADEIWYLCKTDSSPAPLERVIRKLAGRNEMTHFR